MRRTSRLSLLVLTLGILYAGARASAAPGVNLRWQECYGDGGPQNASFACNTNLGGRRLVGSIVLPTDLSGVIGCEIIVDIATASPTLPAWWHFRNVATCRQNSLEIGSPGTSGINCPEWTGGTPASSGINAYLIGLRGPNTARIRAHVVVQASSPVHLTAAQEYLAFILGIDFENTAGAGACSGCAVPACIVLSSVGIATSLTGPLRMLSGPANLTDSDFVTWQGGGVPVVGGATGCPAATPAMRTTWGAVKSLYR